MAALEGKGFVTTATVNASSSAASEAMIGAAPVPVPPPRPTVTKTMSEFSNSRIFSVSSSAASRPTSGLAPSAQTFGEPRAELHSDRRLRPVERLKVGVRHQELDALDAGVDHVIYGVAPAFRRR